MLILVIPPHFDFRHYKQSSGTFYLFKYYYENKFFLTTFNSNSKTTYIKRFLNVSVNIFLLCSANQLSVNKSTRWCPNLSILRYIFGGPGWVYRPRGGECGTLSWNLCRESREPSSSTLQELQTLTRRYRICRVARDLYPVSGRISGSSRDKIVVIVSNVNYIVLIWKIEKI